MPLLLLVLALFLPAVALAQDAPSPMSFDDLEVLEAPASPARAKIRFARDQAIDFAAESIEGDLISEAERLSVQLELAHLLHERGRDERDAEAMDEAIGLYRELLARLPDERLRDHVTFFLGFALRKVQPTVSELRLTEVTERWPGSSYAPHAWLHLGEARFAAGDYERSLSDYLRAADASDFELRGFALYKVAWSQRRRGDAGGARGAMAEVVLDPSRPALAREALKVLDYWSREDLGHPVDPSYVQAVQSAFDAQRPRTCLDDLPEYKRQLAQAPMSAASPLNQGAVVICLAQMGQLGAARAELKRMERMYSRGTRWWKANERWARRDAKHAYDEAEGWVRTR